MSSLWDEREADAIVIANLHKEIDKLRKEISMILRDSKNNLYQVSKSDARLLTEEDRAEKLAEIQNEMAMLQQGLTNQENPSQNETPQQTPTNPEAGQPIPQQ